MREFGFDLKKQTVTGTEVDFGTPLTDKNQQIWCNSVGQRSIGEAKQTVFVFIKKRGNQGAKI